MKYSPREDERNFSQFYEQYLQNIGDRYFLIYCVLLLIPTGTLLNFYHLWLFDQEQVEDLKPNSQIEGPSNKHISKIRFSIEPIEILKFFRHDYCTLKVLRTLQI